jgi:hypothetical protein
MIVPGLIPYDPQEHHDRVRRQGDIPLLTDLFSAMDGATSSEARRDRPSRDTGAEQAADAPLPLPPAPLPEPGGQAPVIR